MTPRLADGPGTRSLVRFLAMAAVAIGLLVLLTRLGVDRWIAVVVAILVAVSLEPTSYVRTWWRARSRPHETRTEDRGTAA